MLKFVQLKVNDNLKKAQPKTNLFIFQVEAYLVNGGEESQIRKQATVLSWQNLDALLEKTTS